jgi:archaemetzincin
MREDFLDKPYDQFKTFFEPFKSYGEGDWIATHKENGQTFDAYKKSTPIRPDHGKKKIYVLTIGDCSDDQLKILTATNRYISACFGVEVKQLSSYPVNRIPLEARRRNREWLHEQLNATYLLNNVLYPNRPEDALALIGFTAIDLYPREGWNFVFGIASLTKRVGVWSIFRNGDPSESEDEYQLCLKRTISTAIHETAHVLGIRHCIAYECVMSGSNSREESDRRDLFFCPHCLQKLNWNTNHDAKVRFEKLRDLCIELKLTKESAFFEKCLSKI